MTREILVVDDEPEDSLPLVHYLQAQGYIVRVASGGMKALSLIVAKRPDLVICDLEMPDIGGYQVMEATATRLDMPDLPFILANEEWTVENWSKPAGGRTADCHFPKPFVLLEVGSFVRRIFKSIDEDVPGQQC
ncbi:MAG: two component transcriptional regulator, LuxR family [Chthonomonadaceae bacterium]|nr:two component transcriptional regulator, LuxR family [Chthonomonadaceae bacterium]